jgi:branched-subunit amino acid ABC-type transport system permease component
LSQFLSYALPGIPYGCAYALMAAGLVLTYKASGVFNLAFGAQAYVSAIVFYVAVADGWPKWAAFVVAVVVLGPVLGYALDRLLFQYARTAPPLVRLVPALGLLIAIPSVMQMIFGTSQRLAPPALALNPDHVYFRIGSVALTGVELLTTGVTVVVIAGLAVMFRSSALGLRMRAVVESPRMTELAGIRADRVGTFAWMLSSLLAGLAGVLLAPIYAALDPSYFTALLVAAIAAAAVGGFASLPLTLVGGVALGVVQEVIGGYLPSGTVLSSGLRPAFPFAVLAVLLVARRSFRPAGQLGDPLAACDPPPASLKPPSHMTEVALGSRAFTGLLVAVFIVITLVLVPGNWEFALTQGLVFAIIFLSITLLTGMSGQISLCQASFAAVGAFTAGQLATHFGTALLLGVVAGGVLAGIVGFVVAVPSLRLGGIALALLTLSFALLGDNVLFQYPWSGNGAAGLSVPRPTIGAVNFAGSGAFFWLALVVLVVAAGVVWLLQHGSVGGELGALRASEVGAASIGINVRRLRVIAFMLSAALAGIGGALYASLEQTVSPTDFNYEFSLVFVVVVATVGVYSVAGAVEAGLAYTVLQQLVNNLPDRYGSLVALIFGLAAVTYVRHPEGAVEYVRRWVLDRAEQFARFLTRNDPVEAELPVGAGPGGR